MENSPIVAGRYLTFREASTVFPFTESSFRWLRHNGHKNGFNSCIRKVGRRVLLDVVSFETWLDGQRDTVKAA